MAWTSDWLPEVSTESAVGAQVKAIQMCDLMGCSQATPLLDPIYGLTDTEEGSLSGDCSLWSFCEPTMLVSIYSIFPFILPFIYGYLFQCVNLSKPNLSVYVWVIQYFTSIFLLTLHLWRVTVGEIFSVLKSKLMRVTGWAGKFNSLLFQVYEIDTYVCIL